MIQKCIWIEFFLRTRRHIKKSFSGCCVVFNCILDCSFEIKCLNESSFFESLTVSNTFYFNIWSIRPNSKFWMFSHPFFNDLCNVLQRWGKLLLLVVTQGNIVCNFTIISDRIHRIHKFDSSFFKFSFFIKNTSFINYNIWIFLICLIKNSIPWRSNDLACCI